MALPRKWFWFAAVALTMSCSPKKYPNPTIAIKTNYGDIIVSLYSDKAPQTVQAFLSYVDSGYFKNSAFYRVLRREDQPTSATKVDIIQGGLWATNYKKQTSLPGIPLETTQQTGILHKSGVISLARNTPQSGNTEFFICIGDQSSYDYGGSVTDDKQGFAAFGSVIKGMKFVKQIQSQPDSGSSFVPIIKIKNIVRLE